MNKKTTMEEMLVAEQHEKIAEEVSHVLCQLMLKLHAHPDGFVMTLFAWGIRVLKMAGASKERVQHMFGIAIDGSFKE